MTIGVDARMLGFAPGIGRYIENLFNNLLVHDTHNDYVFFLRPPMDETYSFLFPNARVVAVPERWYSVREQVTLPFRFRAQKPDLLFVPQFNVPLLAPRPFVVTIHDVTQLYMPGPLQRTSAVRRLGFRTVFARAVRAAHTVIAVSAYTKQEILKNFPVREDKIRVIHEGPGLLPFLEKQPDSLHSKSQLPNPNFQYILAVGVWRPHKNFEGLIDAFAILKRNPQHASLRLVLAGEEDMRYPEVRRTIRAHGLEDEIVTPGVPDDTALDRWYRNAQAVAVPSFFEGFGFVGLEAFARGVPVAAARAGSLPEVLADAALYFNPHDRRDIAEKLARVLEDVPLREQLTRAAPTVLGRYSWERTAQETLKIFTGVSAA